MGLAILIVTFTNKLKVQLVLALGVLLKTKLALALGYRNQRAMNIAHSPNTAEDTDGRQH